MIRMIYAATEDRVIGHRNKLPWILPKDIKQFAKKTTTTDKKCKPVVIMGFNTWTSLPGKHRPLKDRICIVLSRDTSVKLPGAIVYNSINSALSDYAEHDIWIIGGGEILKQTIDLAEEIHLTLIHSKIIGDTYAPIIDLNKWKQVSISDMESEGTIRYQYLIYQRKPHG